MALALMHTNDWIGVAKQMIAVLGGRWCGSSGSCHCPAHQDSSPSLSVTWRDDRLLVHCHAGCSQAAVLAALRRAGLWSEREERSTRARDTRLERSKTRRTEFARNRWAASIPISGTIAERYLRARAVEMPPAGADVLRFHPALRHPSGLPWPGMVAAITHAVTNELVGIHRTFLERNGSDKAPVKPDRMILGGKRGGVIRLIVDEDISSRIAIAEGLETALSAIGAGWPCWSAIDAGNMASLPVWPWCDLAIFADNDAAGLVGAEALARRWLAAGGSATIITAPHEDEDWNDVAQQLARVA